MFKPLKTIKKQSITDGKPYPSQPIDSTLEFIQWPPYMRHLPVHSRRIVPLALHHSQRSLPQFMTSKTRWIPKQQPLKRAGLFLVGPEVSNALRHQISLKIICLQTNGQKERKVFTPRIELLFVGISTQSTQRNAESRTGTERILCWARVAYLRGMCTPPCSSFLKVLIFDVIIARETLQEMKRMHYHKEQLRRNSSAAASQKPSSRALSTSLASSTTSTSSAVSLS